MAGWWMSGGRTAAEGRMGCRRMRRNKRGVRDQDASWLVGGCETSISGVTDSSFICCYCLLLVLVLLMLLLLLYAECWI